MYSKRKWCYYTVWPNILFLTKDEKITNKNQYILYIIYITTYYFIYITLISHDSYIGSWRVPDGITAAENNIYNITHSGDTNTV